MKAHKIDEFTIVGRPTYSRNMRCPKCGNTWVDSVAGNFLVWQCRRHHWMKGSKGSCGFRGPIHEFRGERNINGRWYKC